MHRLDLLLLDVVVVHAQVRLTRGVEASRGLPEKPDQGNLEGAGQLLTQLLQDVVDARERAVLLDVELVVLVQDRDALDPLEAAHHIDVGGEAGHGLATGSHQVTEAVDLECTQVGLVDKLGGTRGGAVEGDHAIVEPLQHADAPQVLRDRKSVV